MLVVHMMGYLAGVPRFKLEDKMAEELVSRGSSWRNTTRVKTKKLLKILEFFHFYQKFNPQERQSAQLKSPMHTALALE